ncbi:MAG: DUF2167 domain-containing protein [Asticcacaulis sp.]
MSQGDAVLNPRRQLLFPRPRPTRSGSFVDVWGNPPDRAEGVLGMVFRRAAIPSTAGARSSNTKRPTISPTRTPLTADYDKDIKQIQDGEADDNAQRKKDGYATTHLVGWAQPPSYDKTHHYMVWARDIQFSDQKIDTLNYDIRILGRRGVLSLNMVDSMPNLAAIRPQAVQLAAAGGYTARRALRGLSEGRRQGGLRHRRTGGGGAGSGGRQEAGPAGGHPGLRQEVHRLRAGRGGGGRAVVQLDLRRQDQEEGLAAGGFPGLGRSGRRQRRLGRPAAGRQAGPDGEIGRRGPKPPRPARRSLRSSVSARSRPHPC